MAKTLARLENEYLPSGWISDAKILMTDAQEGDFLSHKRILKNSNLWLSYNMLRNIPYIVNNFLLLVTEIKL